MRQRGAAAAAPLLVGFAEESNALQVAVRGRRLG
jgi:hypothetical protein